MKKVTKKAKTPVCPRAYLSLVAELRRLSGFGFTTGGGRRVIRKPILEDK